MKVSDYLTLGIKNFKRSGKKNIAPIIIITVGILLFNIVSSFFTSITASVNESVVDNSSLKFMHVSSIDSSLKNEDLAKLKEIEHVHNAFPRTESFVGIEKNKEKVTTTLVGVPNDSIKYFTKSLKETNLPDNGILLNSNIDSTLQQGEPIKISYTVKVKENEGIRKEVESEVYDKVEPPYIISFPEDVSIANLEFVQTLNAAFLGLTLDEYLQNPSYEEAILIVPDVNNLSQVAKDVEDLGYMTEYSLKASKSIPVIAKILASVGGILILVLLVFAGTSIASIINQSLRSRYGEIGIMRAIGYKRKHLIRLFTVEVSIISIISFCLSIMISFIALKLIEQYVNSLGFADYTFILSLSAYQVLASMGVIFLVSFIASAYPIRKASSIQVSEILKGT
ncbi:FtsX-like permease family protein [Rossellomorea sp. SC111]|uniref:ABC transporter permease n=1 Tax=Rossellomorea sp. SC111 TaxID=2968985 RepID=UPI00215B68AA|nr:FtsX-like permease family protein [Rossellomorea sp. SC111]MCR8848282.1 FtsX-like permease family protein [Rossellomorea sp. SC111]